MCKFRAASRQKVAMGYYVIGAFTLTMSVLILLELKFIEQKIIAYEVISDFYETVMEIRRFEKNYFLYKQESDYWETLKYVTTADKSLDANVQEFSELVSPQQIKMLKNDLKKYGQFFQQYYRAEDNDRKIFIEGNIRKSGNDLIIAARDISNAKRANIRSMLKNTRTFLVISIIALSVLGAGIYQLLSKTTVHARFKHKV